MIKKTKRTEEYFEISRKQFEFIYALFLKIGVWKILEIMGMERKSKDEDFIDDFWKEIAEALDED